VLEQHAIPGGYRDLDRDELAAAILPVVAAWAETQARARAAEELRKAAEWAATASPTFPAWQLQKLADALAADDRTDAR
jgi:hypothetical protein